MALSVTELNDVKVYNLTSGKTLPQWLEQRQHRSLKKDEDYRRRIELLQDFDFTTASQKIAMTSSGEYCIAVGTYPPMVKVFEVEQLGMKFERHLDAEVVSFCALEDSWTKLAFLHVDRTVEFHAPYGRHYRTRIPHAGRDMLYHSASCDIYVASSSPHIYRLNLEEGCFMAPIDTSSDAVNVLAQTSHLQLLASGGDNGVVQCWDLRSNKLAGELNVAACVTEAAGSEITALTFAPGSGMSLTVGTSNGVVAAFDLRSTAPKLVKEHQYGDPIVRVRHHTTSGNMISADKHVIKIWNAENGKIVTNVEPTGAVNDFCLVGEKKGRSDPQSGVIMVAGEQPRMMAYYVPHLGVAPYWCSFLDSLTEELEESASGHIFEDYKFVTRDELKQLSLEHLIGTPLLKAYMHGFFMHAKLHAQLQSVADPFAYDRYKKERIAQKIKEKRKSRITIQRRLPKVNQDLAVHMLTEKAKDRETRNEVSADVANPMADSRFAALFTNPDFQIDPDNEDFKRRHGGTAPKPSSHGIDELFEAMEEGGSDADDGAERRSKRRRRKKKKVQLYEASDIANSLVGVSAVGLGAQADASAVSAARQTASRMAAPLADRLAAVDAPPAYRRKPARKRTRPRDSEADVEAAGAGAGASVDSGKRSAEDLSMMSNKFDDQEYGDIMTGSSSGGINKARGRTSKSKSRSASKRKSKRKSGSR